MTGPKVEIRCEQLPCEAAATKFFHTSKVPYQGPGHAYALCASCVPPWFGSWTEISEREFLVHEVLGG